MGKILIVGNSLAVIEAIENIRRSDQQFEISLLCTESLLPYDRYLLPSLVAGQTKETQMSTIEKDFFTHHQVEVIANEVIARVSLKRKYITTQSKRQIDYDQLMVADLGLLMALPIKGHQKKGVFDSSLLSSTKELVKYLPYVDTVFVSASSLQGFNMACALHCLGKEVVVVSPEENFLSTVFDTETGSLLKQIVECKGLRIMTSSSIEEILGDGEVKAIKLSSGKVIATQMVVIDSLELDLRLLEDPQGYERIKDNFFLFQPLHKPLRFGFNLLEGFCMGQTIIPEGGREYLKFDGPQNVFKKIFAKEDVLVGAVLFNSVSHEDRIARIITDQSSVLGQEESLIGG